MGQERLGAVLTRLQSLDGAHAGLRVWGFAFAQARAFGSSRPGGRMAGMSIEERSRQRRRRMVAHRAASWEDAERWDLEFWQSVSPEERLSALVAIRRDVELVEAGRDRDSEES